MGTVVRVCRATGLPGDCNMGCRERRMRMGAERQVEQLGEGVSFEQEGGDVGGVEPRECRSGV